MKNTRTSRRNRRIAAIAAAAMMTACMAVPMTAMMNVSAADITIVLPEGSTDVSVHTYEAYQIFTGDLSVENNAKVLSNIVWGSNINVWNGNQVDATKQTAVFDAIKAINIGTVETPNKPFENATFTSAADVADALAEEAGKDSATTDTAVAKAFADVIAQYLAGDAAGTSEEGEISNLDDGYYLVQDANAPTTGENGLNSGARTRYILEVAGEDVEVNPKSSAPVVEKKVYENTKIVESTKLANYEAASNDIDEDAADDRNWNDVADYCIGDKVPFKLYGTMPSTLNDYEHYYYKFTDTLGKEFTVDAESIVIKVDGKEVADNVFNIHKDVSTNGDETTKIEITIEDVKALGVDIDENSVITVEYEAELNANAVIGLDGQVNKVKLEYSNNPNAEYNPSTGSEGPKDENHNNDEDDEFDEDDTTPETPDKENNPSTPEDESEDNTGDTPEDQVIVFTYELDIDKTNAAITDETAKEKFDAAKLAGAEFVLYKKVTEDNPEYDPENPVDGVEATIEVIYAVVLDENNCVNGWVKGTFNEATGAFESADSSEFEALSSGKEKTAEAAAEYKTIKVIGLDDGTYYLRETKAPTGYNKITGERELVVSATTANGQTWAGKPGDALTALTLNDADALLADEALGRNGDMDPETEDGIDTGLVWAYVENKAGNELPSTGGIGTTLFYVIGGTMAAGAGVALISKKRMKKEQD